MGNFSKQGKHAPGALDANATAALDNSSFNSNKTEAIGAPAGNPADATVVMPKADAATPKAAGANPSGYTLNIPTIGVTPPAGKDFAPVPTRKKRRGLIAFVVTFLVLACVLVSVYVGVAKMFETQLMPNTHIAGIDVSMLHDDEAAQLLEQIPADYQIDIAGGDFSLHLTGEDVGMTIDSKAIVKAMHEEQSPWYWPWYVINMDHDESALLTTSFDEKATNKLVKNAVKAFNKTATAPTDASITFDESTQEFAIVPEKIGTQLRIASVQEVVNAAVKDMQQKAEVTDEQLLQPKLLSTDETLVNTVNTANGLLSTHLQLTINGQTVTEIGKEQLSGYVKINDKFEVSLDEEGLAAWVYELSGSYNTVGMQRNYTRADGKQITVSGGTYGWEVDQGTLRTQILDAIKKGGESTIEIPCIDSANIYAGYGQRDWGNRYIDVDLSEQYVRFYGDDGSIIWEAACITGTPDGEHDTPQGVWYIIMKESPSVLIGYLDKEGKIKDYEEEVEYWMPFVGNGVGFHDATWQPGFGGDMYAEGYGSHGCINLSYSAAESLYNIVQPNDVVVVHY